MENGTRRQRCDSKNYLEANYYIRNKRTGANGVHVIHVLRIRDG